MVSDVNPQPYIEAAEAKKTAEAIKKKERELKVRRCKLDPGLKAPGFKV